MKHFAVILSGCGAYDGSEIHEATMTLLALLNNECTYSVFAPDIEQHHVINHITGEVMNETRNVLIESSRIVRGDIKDMSQFHAEEFDALLLPGGFGAGKNLSNYAFKGSDMEVNNQIANAIKTMYKLKRPIGALCIAPVIIAKVIGEGVNLTIGNDKNTVSNIETMGGKHIEKDVTGVAIDIDKKIFTTPCYMIGKNIKEIYTGCNNLIKEMLKIM